MIRMIEQKKQIMIFAETKKDAILLLTLLENVSYPNLVVALSISSDRNATIDVDYFKRRFLIHSFNDFMLDREYNDIKLPKVSYAAEIMYHFDMAIQQTQSTSLMIVSSNASAKTIGVAAAAHINRIPIMSISIASEINNEEREQTLAAMSFFNMNLESRDDQELDSMKREQLFNALS